MTAWALGMRLRVSIDAVFCVVLGLLWVTQSAARSQSLAERLPDHWTPHMVGWIILALGLMNVVSAILQMIPVTAVVSAAGGIAFLLLVIALWPDPHQSYPVFTTYVAANEFATLLILARDWSRR